MLCSKFSSANASIPLVNTKKFKNHYIMIKNYFTNSRLEYLDNILKELAKYVGEFKSEDIIAPRVSFEETKHEVFGSMYTIKKDIPEGKERMVFRTASIYLENEGLILRRSINPEIPDYMISFKGLELIERGGLLKVAKNEKIKDFFQKTLWFLAILTFAINTLFQILNYCKRSKNAYEKCIILTHKAKQ